MPEYILVVDQGTTGTRAALYDEEGRRIGYSYKKHQQIYPKPGWVEHDPIEIWRNTITVIRNVVSETGVDPTSIRAVGVTNQRETTILWDPVTGKPVYNAIVWQDTRTEDMCREIIGKRLEEEIHRRTGLYVFTYFSATKIRWILENVPKAREKLREKRLLFGTIDTWIIWNMTRGTRENLTPDRYGAHVTDPSNASRTMIYDINRMKWSHEILEELGIPEEILPVVAPSISSQPYGYMSKDIIGAEIPIHGDLGDQQAALVGQTCFKEGEVKSTYGTGTFVLMNIGETPRFPEKGLLTTIAYKKDNQNTVYALEGSIAIAGAAIQWLQENLGIICDPRETEELAEKARGSGGVFFVPAFSGLYSPFWDMGARGLIIGLTRYTRKEHIVHAVLEAIAWRVRDVIEAMTRETRVKPPSLRVDGGATRNNYLMQLQANTLQIPVERPIDIETTGLGAAYAAGLGAGIWKNLDELRAKWRLDKRFEPRWSPEKTSKLYDAWREAVRRAMKWLDTVGKLPGSYAYM